jgi:hypothetical protein
LNKQIREQRHQLSKLTIRCNKKPDTIELPRSLAIVIDARVQMPTTKDPLFFATERKALKAIEQTTTKAVYEQIVAARTRHIAELTRQVDPASFIAEEVQRHRVDIDKFAVVVEARFPGIASHTAAAPAAAHSNVAAAAAAAAPSSSYTRLAEDAQAHFERYLRARVVTEAARIAMEDKEAQELAAQGHADNENAREHVMRGAHNSQTIAQIAERAAAEVYQKETKALAPTLQSHHAPTPQSKYRLHPAFFANPAPAASKKRKHTETDVTASRSDRAHRHDADDDPMDVDDSSDAPSSQANRPSHRPSSFHGGGGPRNTPPPPNAHNAKRQKKVHPASVAGGGTSRHGQ